MKNETETKTQTKKKENFRSQNLNVDKRVRKEKLTKEQWATDRGRERESNEKGIEKRDFLRRNMKWNRKEDRKTERLKEIEI